MRKPKLGAGDVPIILDGEKFVMRPTLAAAQKISRQSGGILEAVRKVGAFDMDMIVSVIGAGLGTLPREYDELGEKVFNTGLANVVTPVIEFLGVISGGGRPPPEEGDEEEQDPPKASA